MNPFPKIQLFDSESMTDDKMQLFKHCVEDIRDQLANSYDSPYDLYKDIFDILEKKEYIPVTKGIGTDTSYVIFANSEIKLEIPVPREIMLRTNICYPQKYTGHGITDEIAQQLKKNDLGESNCSNESPVIDGKAKRLTFLQLNKCLLCGKVYKCDDDQDEEELDKKVIGKAVYIPLSLISSEA